MGRAKLLGPGLLDFVVTWTERAMPGSTGSLDAPLSEAEVEEKLQAFAAPNIGDARTARLWSMRSRLLDPDSALSELSQIVMPPPEG